MAAIIVHGGAAHKSDQRGTSVCVVEAACKKGYDLLLNGATALDAVELTVKCLEDEPLLNAGKLI